MFLKSSASLNGAKFNKIFQSEKIEIIGLSLHYGIDEIFGLQQNSSLIVPNIKVKVLPSEVEYY